MIRAEWTKFSTVRGWVTGMLAAVLLTLVVPLLARPGCTMELCPPVLGPGGQAVTDSVGTAVLPGFPAAAQAGLFAASPGNSHPLSGRSPSSARRRPPRPSIPCGACPARCTGGAGRWRGGRVSAGRRPVHRDRFRRRRPRHAFWGWRA